MELNHPLVGIVGGKGRMGAWFAAFLERQGLRVRTAGPAGRPTPAELAGSSDVVIISVPMSATVKVIREVAPLVRPEALLADLTSIKTVPVMEMLAHGTCQVVGGHPLFGPEAGNSDTLRMALCPGRGREGLAWFTATLERGAIRPVILSPEEHDRRMGVIQGLLHFCNLALAQCIADAGPAMEEIMACATPNFTQALERIKGLLGQPAELFGGLIMDNPHAQSCIAEYLACATQLLADARGRDRPAFVARFNELRAYFLKDKRMGELS